MTAIVLNHAPISEDTPLQINLLLHQIFFLGGKFGVNIYIIIGAWFLWDTDFKSRRIFREEIRSRRYRKKIK